MKCPRPAEPKIKNPIVEEKCEANAMNADCNSRMQLTDKMKKEHLKTKKIEYF